MSERLAKWGAVAAILGMFLSVEGLLILGAGFLYSRLDLPAGKVAAGLLFVLIGALLIAAGAFTNRDSPRPPGTRSGGAR